MERLFAAANLTAKKQFHIIPGNHDLERKEDDIVKKARDSYDYDNGVFKDGKETLAVLNEQFAPFFFALCNRFYGEDDPWSNYNVNPHYLRQKDETALIFLNSALACQENAKDGRLLLNRLHIRQLLEQIDKFTKHILIFAHHPIKELQNQEKTALTNLLKSYSAKGISICWFCGDAHSNTAGDVDGIPYYQVGSLCMTQKNTLVVIPDFVIYDIEDDGRINRKVFRFLQHLNSASQPSGGWKRVYNEPVDLSS